MKAKPTSSASITPSKRAFGDQIELATEVFLQRQGLRSIERQHFARHGEIDLIMQDRDCVVFVEVRYRQSEFFGGGLQSVDARKQERLIKAASLFLASQPKFAKSPCRFDVIAVSGQIGALQFDWRRDAFQVES